MYVAMQPYPRNNIEAMSDWPVIASFFLESENTCISRVETRIIPNCSFRPFLVIDIDIYLKEREKRKRVKNISRSSTIVLLVLDVNMLQFTIMMHSCLNLPR